MDCTAWVLGGLWPAELATVTPETATLARYLSTDLHRISSSANEQLQAVGRSGLTDAARQAAETRVINVARAFAVLRVESTVRQLHNEALEFPTQYLSLNSGRAVSETGGHIPVERDRPPERAGQESAQPRHRRWPPAPEVEVLSAPGQARAGNPAEPTVVESAEPVVGVEPRLESTEQRLRRVLAFAARQEPGVRWAAGTRGDGSVVLATDIAHGWIPSGVELPADVALVEPGWQDGNARALLGETTASETYSPGDRIGRSGNAGVIRTSGAPRALPTIDDLGWQLAEATHWRNGLPRIVNTLAKAAAAGTGVADAETDLLHVQLDTARYQLLAQYPDVDRALLLNCMLLSATDCLASGDELGANYHFAWFQTLSNPPVPGPRSR